MNSHDEAVLEASLAAPDPLDGESELVRRPLLRAAEAAEDAAELAREGKITEALGLLAEANRDLHVAENRRLTTRE